MRVTHAGGYMRLRALVTGACVAWTMGCGSFGGEGSLSELQLQRSATHRERAVLKLNEGQIEFAIREYGESIKHNPYDPEGHFGLGVALHRKGRLDEAEAAFRETLRLDPTHHDAKLNIIALDLQRKNWPQAIAASTELLADATFLNPARGLVNRGWAYYSSGDVPRAEADFREALSIDSSLYQAHLNLGIVLYERGEMPECLRSFERVLEILSSYGPNSPSSVEAEARFRIAQARVKLGQRDEALTQLRAASDRGGRGDWGVKAREYLTVLE